MQEPKIYTTNIKEHSGLKYRIEMRQVYGTWEQRHIWYPAPDTYVTEGTTRVEDWIKSPGGLTADFLLKGPDENYL